MASIEILAYYFLFHRREEDEDEGLSLEERRRRSRRIPRIALTKYRQSAFRVMFDSGNNQALINCCAVDHIVFIELLELFEPVFKSHAMDTETGLIKKRTVTASGVMKGRRQKVDAIGVLGLVLFWYRTRGSCARAISALPLD